MKKGTTKKSRGRGKGKGTVKNRGRDSVLASFLEKEIKLFRKENGINGEVDATVVKSFVQHGDQLMKIQFSHGKSNTTQLYVYRPEINAIKRYWTAAYLIEPGYTLNNSDLIQLNFVQLIKNNHKAVVTPAVSKKLKAAHAKACAIYHEMGDVSAVAEERNLCEHKPDTTCTKDITMFKKNLKNMKISHATLRDWMQSIEGNYVFSNEKTKGGTMAEKYVRLSNRKMMKVINDQLDKNGGDRKKLIHSILRYICKEIITKHIYIEEYSDTFNNIGAANEQHDLYE